MLCPEVWKFAPPSFNIVEKRGKLDEKCSFLKKSIEMHHFNKMISIILPDMTKAPEELENVLADSDHYVLKNFSLSEFVNRTFIEGFVKRGSLYALSLNTKLDTDDCIAITPSGILILHLNKESFQSFGLDGKVSEYCKKRNSKYIVQLDLKSPDLLSGSKYFERVKTSLSREFLDLSIQITWTPPDNTICPSSIAKYFDDKGIQVELAPTKSKSHLEFSLKLPEFGENSDEIEKEYCTAHELVEYAGLLALSCNLEAKEYLSSYNFCGSSVKIGNARILTWKGFFTSSHIEALFNSLCKIINNESTIPWASMYVHGFPHSPVSFALKENHFHTNGDNSFAIFLSSKQEFLWYQLIGNSKIPK